MTCLPAPILDVQRISDIDRSRYQRVSELDGARPEPSVLAWIDGCDPEELVTTAITVAELCLGIELLLSGRRKDAIRMAVFEILSEELGIEPFDESAAHAYAEPAAQRRQAGHPVSFADGQIAAICRCLGATLATRNVDDFAGFGISVVNPWTHATE